MNKEPRPIGHHKIHSFPKIFPVGSDFIPDLFKGKVEVTEKIDGSQFDFEITKEGEIVMRSKGKQMFFDDYEKMFEIAVDFVDKNQEKIREILPVDTYIYGEFLGMPDHNILKYGRVPKNNVIVFGVMRGEGFVKEHAEISDWAVKLDLETVSLLYEGEVANFDELEKLMEIDSLLGNEKVEGIVVKNYLAPCIIGNLVMPSMGKYVREDFKERHATEWGAKFSGSSKLESLIESFRTEARWHKAIQHLKEKGELINEPKDIGILLKELERDLFEEEAENIKKELFAIFKDRIARKAKAGFPEFYKKQLAERAFAKGGENAQQEEKKD